MTQNGFRILIVDDEANARNALAEILSDEGYITKTAADGFKALPSLEEFGPHLVLTDLKMPGMTGLELLDKVREHDVDVPVVLMTAFGEVDTAVSAIQQGAVDYLTKPLHTEALLVVIRRSLEHYRLRQEARALRERLDTRYQFNNILGNSPEMQAVFKTVSQIAKSRATVLVTGASGTGKELVAAALHQHSDRASGPFVKLHCAALAENLLESELFGHERGAFTGADRRREGRFEAANGGTLFLDEIAEITPSTQVKLLRVLQEREFERVGGNETHKTDVRLIAATNRDLRVMVERGTFREDLYYRLNVVNVQLPALRDRNGDIPALASHFLRKFAEENGKPGLSFTDKALLALSRHHWPGNVRELENVVERAVVLCDGELIEVTHLPPELALEEDGAEPRIPGSSLADLERYAIVKTLEHFGGSTSKAAAMLGISMRKIQYKLQEYATATRSECPVVSPN